MGGAGIRIFVSIIAYRDPDLVATVDDCLAKAVHPEILRFGICWQHDETETLPESFRSDQFRVLDFGWQDARGPCWARAKVMELWDGEDWYLQIDAHTRFTSGWDDILLADAARTGASKPIISCQPPGFSPGEALRSADVATIGIRKFTPEGIPFQKSVARPGRVQPDHVRRARLFVAGFLFAPGSFVRDVPYDPELYYFGEEITMVLRAFTRGYDIFEPSRVVVWHNYSREGARRHWEDHLGGHGPAWHELDIASRAKVRAFLANPPVGPDGLGDARTLADYEAYAGISFREQCLQDYTIRNLEPPNPPTSPDWALRIEKRKVAFAASVPTLSAAAIDGRRWSLTIDDGAGYILSRHEGTLPVRPNDTRIPAGAPATPKDLSTSAMRDAEAGRPDQRIFVSIAAYRDPEFFGTVQSCLARARHPERLRFGLSWDREPTEQQPEWMTGDQFRFAGGDWREGRGACRARAEAMALWSGEEWFLQVDSHVRFVDDWDLLLFDDVARSGSDQPVISSYLPGYTPGEELQDAAPVGIRISQFRPEGVVEFRSAPLPPTADRGRPRRARFVGGMLLFAPGRFVRDVPYDPDLYFLGEEISLSVRAFTHGYDLFEPSAVVAYHYYGRDPERKHWTDHDGQHGPAWHELDIASRAKVKTLLTEPWVGEFGLGSMRSLADYEQYAGISFAHRCVQDYTNKNLEPPNPPADPDWVMYAATCPIDIVVELPELSAAVQDGKSWALSLQDGAGYELEKLVGEMAPALRPHAPDTYAATEPWTLHAYATSDAAADFAPVPASKRRAWMDATPEAFARRCLPLSVANEAGWVFRSPFDIAIKWDGTAHKGCLTIELGDPGHRLANLVSDHFGAGIVTFSIPYVFRTPAGIALAVRGAPNFFVDGIHPLEGLVETDWMTATFTMNWRVTRPGRWVRFAKYDPVCFVQPIALGVLESARPRMSPIAAAPEVHVEYQRWSQSRSNFNETNNDPRAWQREYFKGYNTVGEPAPQHRTGLRMMPFRSNAANETRRATMPDRMQVVDGVSCSQTNGELLLTREGRSYRVDRGTILILQACTGAATIDMIAASIADTLDLPLPPVDKVAATLQQLRDAGFIEPVGRT